MLSKASLTTRSTCLQCQLRQVIFHTRPIPPCVNTRGTRHCRDFHGSHRRAQSKEEEGEGAFLKDNALEHDVNDGNHQRISRIKYPLGRLVGKPGRRQRERSEKLKIDSMKKPFDVVVMEDVPELKDKVSATTIQTSGESAGLAARIAQELSQQDTQPGQDEIDQSIDALRPESSFITSEQLEELREQLVESYNSQQLSSYFTKALNLHAVDSDTVQIISDDSSIGKDRIQRSVWCVGATPLEERHRLAAVIKKSELGTNKSKLAQQILHLAWNVRIHSEEQKMGELEMVLANWQVRYLFDVSDQEKERYKSIITSSLLLRNSNLRPYRPDNILRITARRHDAGIIADLIESALNRVEQLKIDLLPFQQLLGKRGWPDHLSDFLPYSELQNVERRTHAAIDRSYESELAIYHKDKQVTQHARRLIISLLDLPSPISTKVLATDRSVDANGALLPEYANSYLPFKYRNLQLSRLVAPIGKNDDQSLVEFRGRISGYQEKIAAHLKPFNKTRSLTVPDTRPASLTGKAGPRPAFWRTRGYDAESWFPEVRFCKLLWRSQQGVSSRMPWTDDANGRPIFSSQIPGVESLLPFFTTPQTYLNSGDMVPSVLIAHFLPSPISTKASNNIRDMHKLPRIQLRYVFDESSDPNNPPMSSRNIRLQNVIATVAGDELFVPLPNEAADLRIVRHEHVRANMHVASRDAEIRYFAKKLADSLDAADSTLTSAPEINFKLAPDMIPDLVDTNEEKEFEYFFERFEQVQAVSFGPDQFNSLWADRLPNYVLQGMRDPVGLRYREIHGGVAGGNSSELSVRYKLGKTYLGDDHESMPRPNGLDDVNLRVVRAALGLLGLLMRGDAGKEVPWHKSEWDEKSES